MNFRNHVVPFHVGGRGPSPVPDPRRVGGQRVAAAVRLVRSFPMRGLSARSSFIHAVLADKPGTRRASPEVPR